MGQCRQIGTMNLLSFLILRLLQSARSWVKHDKMKMPHIPFLIFHRCVNVAEAQFLVPISQVKQFKLAISILLKVFEGLETGLSSGLLIRSSLGKLSPGSLKTIEISQNGGSSEGVHYHLSHFLMIRIEFFHIWIHLFSNSWRITLGQISKIQFPFHRIMIRIDFFHIWIRLFSNSWRITLGQISKIQFPFHGIMIRIDFFHIWIRLLSNSWRITLGQISEIQFPFHGIMIRINFFHIWISLLSNSWRITLGQIGDI